MSAIFLLPISLIYWPRKYTTRVNPDVNNSHQVWSWYDHPLPSQAYSVFVCWYVTWPCELDLLTFWPWTVVIHGGSRDHRRTGWNRCFGSRACFSDKSGYWVEVRGVAAGGASRLRAPKARSPRAGSLGALPRNCWKIDCRKRVFQAFQALSSHFEGGAIPRKRRGELDSDPKMNRTERWLPVHGQPRSAVAGSSESTCDQLGCCRAEWIIQKLHCNIYYSNRNSAEIIGLQCSLWRGSFAVIRRTTVNWIHRCNAVQNTRLQ